MTPALAALTRVTVAGLERPLSAAEAGLLDKYLSLLVKWQRSQRLVGSNDPVWLVENVVVSSLAFLAALPSSARAMGDIGSGAGIPGIPIAVVRPDLEVVLVESRQRRASFLSTVTRELGLAGVTVCPQRAEDLGPQYSGRFDAVVMRCVGRAPGVLATIERLVKVGGVTVVSAKRDEAPLGGERVVVRTPEGSAWWLDRYVRT